MLNILPILAKKLNKQVEDLAIDYYTSSTITIADAFTTDIGSGYLVGLQIVFSTPPGFPVANNTRLIMQIKSNLGSESIEASQAADLTINNVILPWQGIHSGKLQAKVTSDVATIVQCQISYYVVS